LALWLATLAETIAPQATMLRRSIRPQPAQVSNVSRAGNRFAQPTPTRFFLLSAG
jgi:hypothetical protein